MEKVLIFISLVLQSSYIKALGVLGSSLFEAYRLFSTGDPKLVSGSISSGLVTSLLLCIPAIVGLFMSLRLIKSSSDLPSWFLSITKLLSYLWLLFIPLGTVVGILQLRHLKVPLNKSLKSDAASGAA